MRDSNDSWFIIDDIDMLDSPALVLYPDRIKQNILTAVAMIEDVSRLRPHVKTTKCAEVVQLMMAAGITKFKCATIAEAEMLGICGVEEVLLAYQPNGPKLHRFINVISHYPDTEYSCLTDNIVSAQEMSAGFHAMGLNVPVYLDINVGMNRTGIVAGDDALGLYSACSKLAGIHPVGLHAYDGHIRDADFETRKRRCDAAYQSVKDLQQRLLNDGFEEAIIVMGGSPGFSVHCTRTDIECSPGTFIYWDKGYSDLCPEQDFLPAALVITRVVSLPGTNKICVDLGHKSIAAENELKRRVYFLNRFNLEPLSQSEEHLVLDNNSGHFFGPGDVLYGMPYHICPTVALYEKAFLIENGRLTGSWKNGCA